MQLYTREEMLRRLQMYFTGKLTLIGHTEIKVSLFGGPVSIKETDNRGEQEESLVVSTFIV